MTQYSCSTVVFMNHAPETAIAAIAAAGFRHVEISSHQQHLLPPMEDEALWTRTLRGHIKSCGVGVSTVHAPGRKTVLGAPTEGWRREKVQVLAAYLRCAGALGARGVVIHPVPNPNLVPDPERPELHGIIGDATRRSLDDLVPVAREAGVRMLLENLPYKWEFPFFDMTELRRLLDDYPEDAVGLVIDTGHAWTVGKHPADEIRAAGERLHGTHLQDVDADNPRDDHWVPGEGGLDWSAIATALREVDYADMMTFEVGYGRRGESLEELVAMARRFSETWL